jgi:protease secretion system membrane fusion protein
MSEEEKIIPSIDPESIQRAKENATIVPFKEISQKADSWLKSWNPYHPDLIKDRPLEPIEIEESKIRKSATKIFLIGFFIFIIWAFTAPIDAGVSSMGTVMVEGYRKSVQHPTGGVIDKIYVKEGDQVNEGDVLFKLNPLKAEAELAATQLQYINALVTEARLVSERDEGSKIHWPKELKQWENNQQVEEAKRIQQKLFRTRQIEYHSAIRSRNIQIKSLTEEALNNEILAKEGYVSQAQANQVVRSKLDTEMAMNQLRGTYFKEIDSQLSEIQKTRDALKDRMESLNFELESTKIKAPSSGTLIGLKVNTVGGTINPNQMIAEIVPKDAILTIDAQVSPTIIDRVKMGQEADLRFTGFNQNITPVIIGNVSLIGADKLPIPQGQSVQKEEYYLVQVKVTKENLEKLGNVQIQPGMQVDVIFKTGERTFMSYLIKPLTDKIAKAFIN